MGDEGREHVSIGTEVVYNSNPPTSGKHYADWIRSGVYDAPQDDRYLVHSLEHGYVIMSYNCGKKISNLPIRSKDKPYLWWKISKTYAHEGEEDESSDSAKQSTSSATLSVEFESEECKKFVGQLTSVYERKGKKKLIVVPRPDLDVKIALTAWNYIDKFDNFDEDRIVKFIDAHLNQGPEKTNE